jgi:hypothetical protein
VQAGRPGFEPGMSPGCQRQRKTDQLTAALCSVFSCRRHGAKTRRVYRFPQRPSRALPRCRTGLASRTKGDRAHARRALREGTESRARAVASLSAHNLSQGTPSATATAASFRHPTPSRCPRCDSNAHCHAPQACRSAIGVRGPGAVIRCRPGSRALRERGHSRV